MLSDRSQASRIVEVVDIHYEPEVKKIASSILHDENSQCKAAIKKIISEHKNLLNKQDKNGNNILHGINIHIYIRITYIEAVLNTIHTLVQALNSESSRQNTNPRIQEIGYTREQEIHPQTKKILDNYQTMMSLLSPTLEQINAKNHFGASTYRALVLLMRSQYNSETRHRSPILQLFKTIFADAIDLHKKHVYPDVITFATRRQIGLQYKQQRKSKNVIIDQNFSLEIFFEYLKQGVEFNKDKNGKLFLVELIKSCTDENKWNVYIAIQIILSENLAEVNAVDEDINTPLDMAITKKDKELSELIISHGGKPYKHIAVEVGYWCFISTIYTLAYIIDKITARQPSTDTSSPQIKDKDSVNLEK